MEESEGIHWNPKVRIDKWDREEDQLAGLPPDRVEHYEGNLLLNAGITRILNLMTAAGGQAWDAAHLRIGVGNSNTAAAASQTDLQAAAGSSNRQFKLVSSGPTVSAQAFTYSVIFPSGEANFAWEEWGTDAGTADGTTVVATMLNRKVQVMGTKASGSAWTMNVSVAVA